MRKTHYIYILVAVLMMSSCDRISFLKIDRNRTLLASVNDKELYFEDLNISSFNGLSPKDSLALLEAHINKWVKTELKINEGTLQLSESQLNDIERKIEDYRNSLLTFSYDRSLAARVDTLVSKKQIEEYYNSNKDKFKLLGPIVKARVLVYEKGSKQERKFKELAKSKNEDAQFDLIDLAKKGSLRYDDYTDKWNYFKEILTVIPFTQKNFDSFISSNSVYEVTEGDTHYLLAILDYKLTGEYTPLNMVQNSIKMAILNQRRKNYIKEIEDSLFVRSIREGVTTITGFDTVYAIEPDSLQKDTTKKN